MHSFLRIHDDGLIITIWAGCYPRSWAEVEFESLLTVDACRLLASVCGLAESFLYISHQFLTTMYEGEDPVPFNIWINQGSARWVKTGLETRICFSIPSSALGILKNTRDVSEEGDVCDALFTKIRSGRAALVTDDRKGFPVWF